MNQQQRAATYDVYVFCDDCSDIHRMGMKVSLADGPTEKRSVRDFYKGREVPPELLQVQNMSVICPKTRRLFYQEDDNQVFLVPTEPTV